MEAISDGKTTILELRERVHTFVSDRDWTKYHNPKDLAMSIAIEASELMEVFQWAGEDEVASLTRDNAGSARVQAELADVVIYCLSLANVAGIDVAQAVVRKIGRNEEKYPAEEFRGLYRRQAEC